MFEYYLINSVSAYLLNYVGVFSALSQQNSYIDAKLICQAFIIRFLRIGSLIVGNTTLHQNNKLSLCF